MAEESLGAYARDYGIALKRYFLRRGALRDLVEDMVHDVYVRLAARTSREKTGNQMGCKVSGKCLLAQRRYRALIRQQSVKLSSYF